jgi:molecular chaperone DnaJ
VSEIISEREFLFHCYFSDHYYHSTQFNSILIIIQFNLISGGQDLTVEHSIPFMTAVFGGTERLRVRRQESCKTCFGSGRKAHAKPRGSSCQSCGGRGQVARVQQTPFGTIQNIAVCPACQGSGQDPADSCPTCRGKGSAPEMSEVDIRIPAGVDSGTTLRVREGGHSSIGIGNSGIGMGGGPTGKKRGDLFVQIVIAEHPKFKRDSTTILSEEEISFTQAILGTVVKVDTIDGKTEIRIPAGTQPFQKLRIRGKGVTKLGGGERGDQIITVRVRLPTPAQMSEKEKELIQQLAALQK